ncbi:hypothetical protein [uncultured Senegalimassilia sp.]|uniref:Uncharacterized protein n=1 Tax=Siphoviridae sp. ctqBc4 TaxID=2827945 RepID=A0A8S5SD35_9CAUD|nr:hypothetical protein [uncultured Senegalimassilia sp.]DAF48591.1 MAG TPA: hypothetical protein [Siphoviridae sp. ctqBc4]
MDEQTKTMRKLLSELNAKKCDTENAWRDAGFPWKGELWDEFLQAKAQYEGAKAMAQALGL